MKKLLFSIMLFVFSSNASAFELWQGLEFDAAPHEVTKKFPNAKPDTSPRFLAFGFDKKLVLSNYVVLGTGFDVTFLMRGNKLKEVRMQANSLSDPNVVWSRAYDALSLKYGEPSTDLYKMVRLPSATWSCKGIEIGLLTPLDSDKLYISYSASLADNASKL
ncbi:hypothetical protein RCH20_002397 [Psychrobacter sp. PL15]|uniref:hypothetical protein n=1 Tax=Psychrobacter sp. PL15 TaxID=3071719 RepID=UPI002E0C752E|nr:hypothetical protein [Psychrobacter sp. PL15]